MNLFKLIDSLNPTDDLPELIPSFLYGAFRRKSISFCNGLTDEKTIVYWFQSRSFTIDLRLKKRKRTPIPERQGWIGNTIWNQSTQLLSWEVADYANYQNYVQWPESARLHMIGNSILEFSPSNVYVEDWRQQVKQGLFLGLRLQSAFEVQSGNILQMDGGLIICGHHIAYALSRLPKIQAKVSQIDFSKVQTENYPLLDSFEVSISIDGQYKTYSTCSDACDQPFNMEQFEIVDAKHILQRVSLCNRDIELIFSIDVYQPDYVFQHTTVTTDKSIRWLQSEYHHLMYHAQQVI